MTGPRLRPATECPSPDYLHTLFYIDADGGLRHRERPVTLITPTNERWNKWSNSDTWYPPAAAGVDPLRTFGVDASNAGPWPQAVEPVAPRRLLFRNVTHLRKTLHTTC